ncbi:hypothetical protein AAVH_15034 [Aphelenchoides avenae]|nr:hypothetical protein AAVH_15034 [Aphelenchus avenae]
MTRDNRDVIAVLTFILLCFSLSVSQTDSFLMLVSVDRSLFENGDPVRYRSVDLDKRLAMLTAQMNVGCRKLKQVSAGGPTLPVAQYVQEPYSSFLKNGEWLDKVYRKYIAVIQELFAADNMDASRAKNEAITKAIRRVFEQAGVDKNVGGRINVSGCTDNGDLVLEILVDPKLRHEEDQSPVIDIDDTSGLQKIDKSKLAGAGLTLGNLIFWIVVAVFGSLVLMCVYNCCAACFRLQKDGRRRKKKSQVVDIEDAPLKDDSQKDRHESDVSNEYAEYQSAPTDVIEERP